MLNKNHRYKILQDFISHQRHRKLNKVTQLTRSYEVNLKDIENCQSDIKRPPGWQRFFFSFLLILLFLSPLQRRWCFSWNASKFSAFGCGFKKMQVSSPLSVWRCRRTSDSWWISKREPVSLFLCTFPSGLYRLYTNAQGHVTVFSFFVNSRVFWRLIFRLSWLVIHFVLLLTRCHFVDGNFMKL